MYSNKPPDDDIELEYMETSRSASYAPPLPVDHPLSQNGEIVLYAHPLNPGRGSARPDDMSVDNTPSHAFGFAHPLNPLSPGSRSTRPDDMSVNNTVNNNHPRHFGAGSTSDTSSHAFGFSFPSTLAAKATNPAPSTSANPASLSTSNPIPSSTTNPASASAVPTAILGTALQLLSPADIRTAKKRTQNDEGVNKVRLVEQPSRRSEMRELGNRIGRKYQEGFEKTVKEYKEKADERLKQAEEQLKEANQRADKAKMEAEISRIRGEEIAKRSEELSEKAQEQLLVAIARAERAEKQVAIHHGEMEEKLEKVGAEIEKKFKEAIKWMEGNTGQIERMEVDESTRRQAEASRIGEDLARRYEELSKKAQEQLLAATKLVEQQAAIHRREAEEKLEKARVEMERKFDEALKRMARNTGQIERMDVDKAQPLASRRWRDRKKDNSEDDNLDAEDEAVESLLLSPAGESSSVNMTKRPVNKELLAENSEGHPVPESTVDDSDDEMGTESDDEQTTTAQKGKGRQITVPPPIVFSRPRGGARPAVIQMNRGNNHVRFADLSSLSQGRSSIPSDQLEPSLAPSQSTASPRPSPDRPSASSAPSASKPRQRPGRMTMQRGTEPIFGVEFRSSRPANRRIYPQSKLRGFSTLRKLQLGEVRGSMNRLMNIEHDKDVVKIDTATEEEILEFAEGTTTAPELNPMRPYLENSKRNDWNDALCDMFVDSFQQEQGIELGDEDRETVERMFLDRLARLCRLWKEAQKFTSAELFARDVRSNALARKNTRRVDLLNNRLEICHGNLITRDGSIDPGWKAMTEMIQELGPAGMSSDESEMDEETKKTTYKIRRRLWRAKVCKDRLMIIDRDRNVTNALGGARPGKQPRERIRSSTTTISKRAPKVGCPENYYSREWVKNLGSERLVRALNMGERKDLGSVQDTYEDVRSVD